MQAESHATTTMIDMPVLRIGNHGEAVRFLQQVLIAYGVLDDDLLTGDFLAKTDAAVKKFQRAYDLQVDGTVGRQTWWQLGAIVSQHYYSEHLDRIGSVK
jgi:peptidoglycan hydrolase-like protein with peptidoglycan-binding domain